MDGSGKYSTAQEMKCMLQDISQSQNSVARTSVGSKVAGQGLSSDLRAGPWRAQTLGQEGSCRSSKSVTDCSGHAEYAEAAVKILPLKFL